MRGSRPHPRIRACVFALLTLPSLALAQDERCPEGGTTAGDLGIRAVRCVGPSAACSINRKDEDGVLRHVFAVEPVVEEVAPSNSGDAGLEVGDVLVAVDGRLITTREGGRYLANLSIGRTVTVVVRRRGQLRELAIPTVEGCGIRSLSVVTGTSG